MDTIFALSSGSPPAGIAVIRVSGPGAREALLNLAGTVPQPRVARYASLRAADGTLLDRGLLLWFPGPGSATGEDLAELHLHGGRAVVAAVEAALGQMGGVRRAQPGEFTRRAFLNGRIDLAEAEGLADLLAAETEMQRQAALAMVGGALSRKVERWCQQTLGLSAEVEAVLDFEDEGDVGGLPADFLDRVGQLAGEISAALSAPKAETLREGYRVALAGPPNAGKSTLFNALTDSEAAITAPSAGTTRDVLVRPVGIDGVPFSFVDTAGLREDGHDEVELIGIARARTEIVRGDLTLWLGPEGEGPSGAWEIEAQIDSPQRLGKRSARHRVSARTGEGVDALKCALAAHARHAMPKLGEATLDARQRLLLAQSHDALEQIGQVADPLLFAEQLRIVRIAFDRLIGRASTEDMLDALFGRFCIGK